MKKTLALGLFLASCHPVNAQDNVNLNAQVHDHYKTVFIQVFDIYLKLKRDKLFTRK